MTWFDNVYLWNMPSYNVKPISLDFGPVLALIHIFAGVSKSGMVKLHIRSKDPIR